MWLGFVVNYGTTKVVPFRDDFMLTHYP
jgi:hypothetical protein